MRAALLLMGLLLGLSSVARADCPQFAAPLTEDILIGLISDSLVALDNDDVETYRRVQLTIFDRLPCLEGTLPRPEWAAYLVGLAVVEYAENGDWEPWVATAVRIDPEVERDYGPEAIQRYIETADPRRYDALPTDATHWLDGVEATTELPLDGTHVLQRARGGERVTLVVDNGSWPEDWKVVLYERRRRRLGGDQGVTWGNIGVYGGYGVAHQLADETSVWFPEVYGAAPVAGVASYGVYGTDAGFGVFWDVTVPVQIAAPLAADVFAGLSVPSGPIGFWVGAGAVSLTLTEGEEMRQVILPQPHLGVLFGTDLGRSMALDVGVAAGWSRACAHLNTHLGVLGESEGPIGWYVGPDFTWIRSVFVEYDGDNVVAVGRWRAGLRVGIAFGG